jgi:hypothetical protein
MIKLTFNLPDEIEEYIKSQGYDVNSYIQTVLIQPLLDGIEFLEQKKLIEEKRVEIYEKVNSVKENIGIQITKEDTSVEIEKDIKLD